ncbi:MAG: FHA domain-containing protein [Deltaproteobacteria bacterium]|nr:FHA domain-containing protein [Deltaproteobacteria bacterium]
MHTENGNPVSAERSKTGGAPNNDLYLQDSAEKMHISREHFQIEQRSDGGFELVDRGSACGTRVGKRIISGGGRGGRGELKHGDTIAIGLNASPYVFRFVVQD